MSAEWISVNRLPEFREMRNAPFQTTGKTHSMQPPGLRRFWAISLSLFYGRERVLQSGLSRLN